ncbi:PREDICTED: cilia- and flagella-associated protein 45-like [Dufourea novaeangliae]|uniref:Cilia- and flagella-associated protein 45 n=1 Tax=Dufourea novaeangliae TaxID=178035 RepID=A0A154PSH0_DUFNO|nr:PREDICTED: cilia- and flagella-associated protein 45-like [Dufourea novaeangliae]KZC14208.1 Coiled-coil domain-containing protein 19, mitochondrial [Dufourea novaeangliae]
MKVTPKKKPLSQKILTKEEYEGFRECGSSTTKEEHIALKAEAEERERLIKESMERKKEFRKLDKSRPREKSADLVEIEEEARKRTNHVLERAHNMKLEQEEEIQRCNRIILETKCRAIRDAQLAEKRLIELELEEEEKRLNDMMENERRWVIKEEHKKEQEEAAKKLEFANSLKDQIRENEEQRLLEFARKQEESRLINLSNIAWQQAEVSKLRNKEAECTRIQLEIAEGNEQLKHLKAMEEQENKIIDHRIQEYQKRKQERDEKLAEKRKHEKLKKEQGKAKVASQALQYQGIQARIDELNAARIQEEVEREWRQKEKEEALKRAEAQKSLIKEREKQINNKRIMQAIELERERREFEKIVRVQKEAFCREQKELEQKQRQALIHRSEILKQVNEKERERIETRQKMFEEGLANRTEAEIRKTRLREAMEKKCDEMRGNKVPDMYINEVKRMIENIH